MSELVVEGSEVGVAVGIGVRADWEFPVGRWAMRIGDCGVILSVCLEQPGGHQFGLWEGNFSASIFVNAAVSFASILFRSGTMLDSLMSYLLEP